jgi:hypothetical protein
MKRMMAAKRVLFAIMFAGFISVADVCAEPVIYDVSGSLTDGGPITVSGNAFGTKSPAKPYLWAPFDGSLNPSPLGRKTSWTEIDAMVYDAGCGPDSSGCAKDSTNRRPVWTLMVDTTGDFNLNDYSQKYYLFKKTKKTFSVVGLNWKVWRVWAYTDRLTIPDMYIAQGNGCAGSEGGPGTYCWGSTSQAGNTSWMTEEIVFQANSGPTGAAFFDTTFRYYINSALNTDCSPGNPDGYQFGVQNGADYSLPMIMHYPVHGVLENENQDVPADYHYYVDDVYMDTTWARVMICDAATWIDRTHCEIQIPSAWSSTSITIVAHRGTFTGGSNAYLYVLDADGNVNTDGYLVTFAAICPEHAVKIQNQAGYYVTLDEAYDDANDGQIILMQAITFDEDINIDKNLTLKGGYDCGFTAPFGFTTISSLTVDKGSVIIDRLIIK